MQMRDGRPGWWVLILGLVLGAGPAWAQPFTRVADFPSLGMYRSAAAWGDFGFDGDLDVMLTGNQAEEVPRFNLLRFQGGFVPYVFTDADTQPLPPLEFASLDLADVDADRDLDLLVTGRAGASRPASHVYRTMSDSEGQIIQYAAAASTSELIPVEQGDARWGDFDNDGDPDVLLTGMTVGRFVTQLYRNASPGVTLEGWTFVPITTSLPAVANSAVAWADFDYDGDQDVVLAGRTAAEGFITRLYRNDGEAGPEAWRFTEVPAGLPGVAFGDVATGDFDNDGDDDLAVTGCTDDHCRRSITRLYRNDGAFVFTQVPAELPGRYRSTLAWGDHDADGDLDLLLSGEDSSRPGNATTAVYRNDDGTFTDLAAGLPGVTDGTALWGDYDLDGDLDLFLSGYQYETGSFHAAVYRNDGDRHNTRPAVPAGPTALVVGPGTVRLAWEPATDAETPSAGLTYSVRVGTGPGSSPGRSADVVTALAHATGPNAGRRQVPRPGNAGHRTEMTLHGLVPGETYYWSVQAVDHSFAGSRFSEDGTFTMPGANDNFMARLVVQDNSPNTESLYFGTRTDATDGFDAAYDIPAPGPVAPGGFDAYFILGARHLRRDVRNTNQGTLIWQVYGQAFPSGGIPLSFHWNPDELPPEGNFRFQGSGGAGGVDLDMRQTRSHTHALGASGTYRIVYTLTTPKTDTGVEPELPAGVFAVRGNYPNPAVTETHLLVDLPATADVRVEVFDVLGRRVRTQGWQQTAAGRAQPVRVETAGLAAGLYLYRVQARTGGPHLHTAAGRLVVAADR